MAAGAAAADAGVGKSSPVTADLVRETLLQAACEAPSCPNTYLVVEKREHQSSVRFLEWDFAHGGDCVDWRIEARSSEEAIVCLFDQLEREEIGDPYDLISREIGLSGDKDTILSWAYELSAVEEDNDIAPFCLLRPGYILLPSPLSTKVKSAGKS